MSLQFNLYFGPLDEVLPPVLYTMELHLMGPVIGQVGGMHFTPSYPISCGWLIRRPRTCCTISE